MWLRRPSSHLNIDGRRFCLERKYHLVSSALITLKGVLVVGLHTTVYFKFLSEHWAQCHLSFAPNSSKETWRELLPMAPLGLSIANLPKGFSCLLFEDPLHEEESIHSG